MIRVEELKEPEEVGGKVSEEGKVSDGTLFALCCSDLGISQQTPYLMTSGQHDDLMLHFKK